MKLFRLLIAIIPIFISSMVQAQSDTVEIHDSFFSPSSITVQEGTEVVWEHVGGGTHTTTSGSPCSPDGIWDSGNMTNGQTFSYTFNDPGNFPYFCVPHCGSGMTGNVEVLCTTKEDSMDVIACDSYTVPSGSDTYTSAGNYEDTVQTAAGCDSVLYIDLTVNNSSNSSITRNECYSFTVPSGDTTYTSSGNYKDTLTNSEGCDSIIDISLTLDTSSGALSPSVCDSFTAPSGNATYSSSGNYVDTLTNSAGCDSLIMIDLSVNAPDTSVSYLSATELEVAQTGASYQWLDCDDGMAELSGETARTFEAEQNGNFAVEVTNNGCTDTSSCYEISDVGLLEHGFDANVRFYPNPTEGELKIELEGRAAPLKVLVRDMKGRVVHEERVEDPHHFRIPLGEKAGLYTVELLGDDGERSILRVMKE